MPEEYRVLRLRVGPAVVAKDAGIPDLIGVTGSDARATLRARRDVFGDDPFPLGPTALERSDLTVENVSLQEVGGVVTRASYVWTGEPRRRDAFASQAVIVALPGDALFTSTSGAITEPRERTCEWDEHGVHNRARVHCPLIHVWSRERGGEIDRPAHPAEYHLISLEQSCATVRKKTPRAVVEEPPLPAELLIGAEATTLLPKTTRRSPPVYPSWARQLNVTGTINLSILVSEEGDVTEISVLRDNPVLRANAIAAISTWKYEPVLVGGRPTRWRSAVNLTFKLH